MSKLYNTSLRGFRGIRLPFFLAFGLIFFFQVNKLRAQCDASFADSLTTGKEIVFTSKYRPSLHKITYYWSFGDGSTLAGSSFYNAYYATPSHTYTAYNTSYTVCLIVLDSTGTCSDSVCRLVTTGKEPCMASYTPKYDSTGKVTFSNLSTSPGGNFTSTWDFGDKSTSTLKNPVHSYSATGYNHVCLTITDSTYHCSNTYCNYVYPNIYSTCRPSMRAYRINDTSYTFVDSSTAAHAYTLLWDFGDGSTSTSSSQVHTYTPGSYKICLTITDTVAKCTVSQCNTVNLYRQCYAVIASTQSGNTIYVSDSSPLSPGRKTNWDFGDGTTSTLKKTSHSYAINGSYKLTLTVTDSTNNCTATTNKTITNTASCSAKMQRGGSGNTVLLVDSSIMAHGHRTHWDFGDGSTSNDVTVAHNYKNAGYYKVELTVTDSITNCMASSIDYVTIKSCISSFTYTNHGKKVHFTSTSTSPHTISIYIWNFGDGTGDSTSGPTVTHTYTGSADSFIVSLLIYDTTTFYHCYDQRIKTIFFCKKSITYESSVTDKIVSFMADDSSLSAPITYAWDFGDSTTSSAKNPTHTYSHYGNHTVCLTESDSYCTVKSCYTLSVPVTNYCTQQGRVVDSNFGGLASKVYLIKFDASDSSLAAVDSVTISDTSGRFSFCHLQNGDYYLKAALASGSSVYSSYLPTYYDKVTRWKDASKISINYASMGPYNIRMKKGANPGGPGFIKGKITAGANKAGDPLSGILVILYDDKGNPIAYTYTDADGNYEFKNIPLGKYHVEVEILGKSCSPAIVELTPAKKEKDSVDMAVGRKEIHSVIYNRVVWQSEQASIYPNPVSDKLVLDLNVSGHQQISIAIYDIAGKKVSETMYNCAAGHQQIAINTASLPQGMYMMKTILGKEQKMLEARFVKE